MNAIIYCRVSTTKNEQETSLNRQLDELTQLAQKNHMSIVDCITEKASGYHMDRDGIFKMFDYFAHEEANCLLIQDETRLGRGHTKIALFHQLQKLKDRKSTRLNSSHVAISYAVFCLK